MISGLLLLLGSSLAFSQAEKATAQKSGYPKLLLPDETFASLKKDRRSVATEIEGVEGDIRRIESELANLEQRAEDDPRRLAQIERDLVLIQQVSSGRSQPGFKPRVTDKSGPRSFADYLYSLRDSASLERERQIRLEQALEIQGRSEKIAQLRRDLGAKRSELPAKRDKLFDLEERISDLLDTSRNQYFYRAGVSIIFAAIVFFLVLKFFRVVDSDASVKQSIFSGDAGIQFITLFSIVIAVILFGILGILGANELSALLGGLSGYILGKARPSTSPPSGSTPTPTP